VTGALAFTVIARAQLDQDQADQSIATGRQALHVLRQIDSSRVADELQLVLDRLPDTQSSQVFREEIDEGSTEAELPNPDTSKLLTTLAYRPHL
jgi:hypothetical protein